MKLLLSLVALAGLVSARPPLLHDCCTVPARLLHGSCTVPARLLHDCRAIPRISAQSRVSPHNSAQYRVIRPLPDEPAIAYNAIALIECGDFSGTAWWVARNRIVTAYHVAGERPCSIGGVRLARVHANAMEDVAVYAGLSNSVTLRIVCTPPRQGSTHHGVGFAFGVFRHSSRLVATGARDSGHPEPIARGMYVFEGGAYPGQSGGPVFDSRGRVVSMINRGTRTLPMMTQGRAMRDTFLCGGRT